MTIENTTLYSPLYVGDGVEDTFDTDFYFIDENEIEVYTRGQDSTIETVLTLGTDYTVIGAGDPDGGSIILTSPLSAGTRLRIVPNVPITQQVSYKEGTKFLAETQEKALDRQTQVAQYLAYKTNLMGRLATSDSLDPYTFPQGGPGVAGWLLRFSIPSGDSVEAVSPFEVATGELGSEFGVELFNADDAADARSQLELGTLATQNGTFSGTSSGTNTGDQNTLNTINVTGEGSIVASSLNDSVTFEAGTDFAIQTDPGTNTINFGYVGQAGKVVQVVNTLKTDAALLNPTNSWNVISDFSCTITPSSVTSRILVLMHMNMGTDTIPSALLRLYRNGSAIPEALGNAAGNRTPCTATCSSLSSDTGHQSTIPIMFLDQPGTTSPCTYEVAIAAFDSSGQDPGMQCSINRSVADSNSSLTARSTSSIILMEIVA